MTSMIFSNVLLLVFVFIALLTNDATCENKKLTREDLMNNCHSPASGGPLCLRMDQSNTANSTLKNCNRNMNDMRSSTDCPAVPFASIKRIDEYKFKVRLIGKLEKNTGGGGDGWVGLAFSKDSERIMKRGAIGVVCIHQNRGHSVRVVQIQNRDGSTPDDYPESNIFNSQSLRDSGILKTKVRMTREGYLLCEFEMNSELFLDSSGYRKYIDLLDQDYMIGLAYRDSDPLVENEALMGAHKKRGSSEFKFGLLKELAITGEEDTDTIEDGMEDGKGGWVGGGASGTHTGAKSTINKMVISLVLLNAALRI